jgi:hypothetical protein
MAGLAAKMGIGTPDERRAGGWLQEARVSNDSATVVIGREDGPPHVIIVEPRRPGAPYFARTNHLHISHAGRIAEPALQVVISRLAARLADVTFAELCPPRK